MFSKNIRRALVAMIALPMALSLQGCTDQEALAVLGGVALVGGAVAIGVAASNNDNYNDNYHYHQHNDYHYHTNPPPYYGGGYHYGNGCAYYGSCGWRSLKSNKMSADELNDISLMAARYNLPLESAATLKVAVNTALQTQNLQPVLDLGLSRSDLADIGSMKMISDSSLNKLAGKLSVSQEQARGVVQRMMSDIQASQAAQ